MTKIYFIVFIIIILLLEGLLFSQRNTFAQNPQQRTIQPKRKGQTSPQNRSEKRDQQLFRTARSYLNINRYDKAIKILEDLNNRNPENLSFYQTLLQAYLIVSRVNKADSLVKNMLQRQPQNPLFQIDRANVLYKKDKKEEATKIWETVLKAHPQNINVYHKVATAMLQNHLYDSVIEVYKLAVRNIPNSEYLYQNIANLYRARLMYVEAARYYLKYLKKQPKQQKYIFKKILSFRIEAEQRPEFFRQLENIAGSEKKPDSEQIYFLIAQLYQRYEQFDKAFQIYKRLEQENTNGNYLLQFGKAARQDSSYQIALQAYELFIEKHPKSNKIMEAYSGAVSVLFSLAKQSGETQYADRALKLIETIRSRFSHHPNLANFIYLQAVFSLDYFFDVDRAMTIFSEVISFPKVSAKNKNSALLKLGECYLIKGQLNKALTTFSRINHPPQEGVALFLSAQTYYFMKDWEKALEAINTIIRKEGVKGEVTNNALELQMRISLAETSPQVISKLSEADLLIFQQKKSEAKNKFDEILGMSSLPPMIKSEVYLKLTNLSLDLNEIPEALDYCSQAIRDSSLLHYGDEHLFLLANMLEHKVDEPQEAFKIYEQLLRDYPNSLLAEQARDRMKFLREQKIIEIP